MKARQSSLWLSLLLLILLLSGPKVGASALLNTGYLALRSALLEKDVLRESHNLYGILDRTPLAASALKSLRLAMSINNKSIPAHWALGRASLSVGDAETAAYALEPLIHQAEESILLYEDIVNALSRSDQQDRVIALYESVLPPRHTQIISDTLTLAYLEQGNEEAWDKALEFRPDDLTVNYYRWRHARDIGNIQAAKSYSRTLNHVSPEAVNPIDDRLSGYVAPVVPKLLGEGVWSRDRTLNVVSVLVWRHSDNPSVVQLLNALTARYPSDPDWLFYLAELHQRRGDWTQAELSYKQVIEKDPDYRLAYLRLAMVIQQLDGRWDEAVLWCDRYTEWAPDDLMGLKCLTEICQKTGQIGAGEQVCADLDVKALRTRTDDQRIVADLLEMPAAEIELGSSLLENSGFEAYVGDRPKGWKWVSTANEAPFNASSFTGGYDRFAPFTGEYSIRIDGLWLERSKERSPARAGFRYYNELQRLPHRVEVPQGVYALSLDYRTSTDVDGLARVWLSKTTPVFWTYDYPLPGTNGSWYHFVAVDQNSSGDEVPIRPLVRSFGLGQVMVDNLRLRRVNMVEDIAGEIEESRFRIVKADK